MSHGKLFLDSQICVSGHAEVPKITKERSNLIARFKSLFTMRTNNLSGDSGNSPILTDFCPDHMCIHLIPVVYVQC